MTTTQNPHADVLVVHASKNGGTAGIATMVADELRANGLAVDIATAADAAADGVTLAGYRAVVLGSAVYMGRWRPEALRFLRRRLVMLRERQLWLFQSGPCGPDAVHEAEQGTHEPKAVRNLRENLEAAPPITFGGLIDPTTAHGFLARRMASGERAGDYRDQERIRAWARGIAAQVRPVSKAG